MVPEERLMARRLLKAAPVAFALALAVAAAALAGGEAADACTPKFVNGAMHLCGPATAHLSVFGSYTFRNGTCKRTVVAGEPDFVLELGALKPGSTTNGGLSYFKIQISGPLSHPTTGSLIAWHGGKRWSGYGQSFRGNAIAGTFVVSRLASGAGRATGSFHC
jgi:hypothetical protein